MKKLVSVPLCWLLACALVFGTTAAADPDRALYDRYAEIAENVAEKYHADIELDPYDTFDPERMPSLSEFENTLNAIGLLTTAAGEDDAVQATSTTGDNGTTCTVCLSARYGSGYFAVEVTGDFVTQYELDYGCQVFKSAAFSERCVNSGYTWTTTINHDPDKYNLVDHKTTCLYSVQGNISFPGGTWNFAEICFAFDCSAKGKVAWADRLNIGCRSCSAPV